MADEFIRPSGDTTLDGWTDEADGTTTIYTKIDESTAGDSDYVQSPVISVAQADLKVRLLQGSTQIAQWTHSNISETFADAAQTLSAPELASISDFNDLNIELDDNAGSVYKFALGNPTGALTTPVVVRYRYKKLVVEDEVATTTWNPADKSASITLDGTNLIATRNSTNNNSYRSVRSVASNASGKKYFEYLWTTAADQGLVGVGDNGAFLESYLGSSTNSVGWFGTDGNVYRGGGGPAAAIGTFGNGDRISIALDIGNGRIWFRKNGGNWNNNGSADPATNVGGIDVSGLTGPFYAAATLYSEGTPGTTYGTANFGASTYAYTVPSGFSNWGT